MPLQPIDILGNTAIRTALLAAWVDSKPGVTGGHEEGGFILQDTDGNLNVARWPTGQQNRIVVPPHPNCKIGDDIIVATFHTHPNTGANFLQEPGETDKRAVRDDPDLKGGSYLGEFVIAEAKIYHIATSGHVSDVGERQNLLF